MIAFEYIEGAAIGCYIAQRTGDINIWIGVAIPVRVCGEIVRHQVAAYCDVLRNGFPVIACHAGLFIAVPTFNMKVRMSSTHGEMM